MSLRARLIAFHLPQFHPIPENNDWWEQGFTEWTNTTKAQPLFSGHYQPHLPADLGFYDLRLPEARQAQASLAKKYGLEGFCYYHYWFAGKRILERPVEEIVQSGKPDFPFCLCWANESWTGIWHGAPKKILIEQTYPGTDDYEKHFEALLPAFRDSRYLKVEGKLLFAVYKPLNLPDQVAFTSCWQALARQAGLPGIYFVGIANAPWEPIEAGFCGAAVSNTFRVVDAYKDTLWYKIMTIKRRLLRQPVRLFSYEKAIPHLFMEECSEMSRYPCAIPNWDNTPRSGTKGLVLDKSSPKLFRRHLRQILNQVSQKPPEHKIVFVKSWNEWAEGNHLEPDREFGRAYLEVIASELGVSPH